MNKWFINEKSTRLWWSWCLGDEEDCFRTLLDLYSMYVNFS